PRTSPAWPAPTVPPPMASATPGRQAPAEPGGTAVSFPDLWWVVPEDLLDRLVDVRVTLVRLGVRVDLLGAEAAPGHLLRLGVDHVDREGSHQDLAYADVGGGGTPAPSPPVAVAVASVHRARAEGRDVLLLVERHVEQHDDVWRGVVSGKALGGKLRLDGRHDALVDELVLGR